MQNINYFNTKCIYITIMVQTNAPSIERQELSQRSWDSGSWHWNANAPQASEGNQPGRGRRRRSFLCSVRVASSNRVHLAATNQSVGGCGFRKALLLLNLCRGRSAFCSISLQILAHSRQFTTFNWIFRKTTDIARHLCGITGCSEHQWVSQ